MFVQYKTAWLLLLVLTNALSQGALARAPSAAPMIKLQKIVGGLEHVVDVKTDDAGRMFAVEQHGRIRLVTNGKLDGKPYFLDIQKNVFDQGECGLLGLALHPDFAKNG